MDKSSGYQHIPLYFSLYGVWNDSILQYSENNHWHEQNKMILDYLLIFFFKIKLISFFRSQINIQTNQENDEKVSLRNYIQSKYYTIFGLWFAFFHFVQVILILESTNVTFYLFSLFVFLLMCFSICYSDEQHLSNPDLIELMISRDELLTDKRHLNRFLILMVRHLCILLGCKAGGVHGTG